MLQKACNIAKNSLKRKNLGVMIGKVLVRFSEKDAKHDTMIMRNWCEKHSKNCADTLKSIDATLWQETQDVCKSLQQQGEEKLKQTDKDLGGGGNYHLLYFMVRHLQAKVVVETGVAAGWSSQAILTALKANENNGQLYSSDFPYFRYENPEALIGFIVDDTLKANWDLFIDGDQNNLPKIAHKVDHVDVFHYDSDKSYKGRSFAYETLLPKFNDNTVVIFDDIQDNLHFKDFVEKERCAFRVFEFEGKYVGLISKELGEK